MQKNKNLFLLSKKSWDINAHEEDLSLRGNTNFFSLLANSYTKTNKYGHKMVKKWLRFSRLIKNCLIKQSFSDTRDIPILAKICLNNSCFYILYLGCFDQYIYKIGLFSQDTKNNLCLIKQFLAKNKNGLEVKNGASMAYINARI